MAAKPIPDGYHSVTPYVTVRRFTAHVGVRCGSMLSKKSPQKNCGIRN